MSIGTRTMENIAIKHYHGPTLSEGATIARKARLYVSGWNVLRLEYRLAELYPYSERSSQTVITVAYSGDSAIASVTTYPYGVQRHQLAANPNIYVQKRYRRKGVGTMLFKEHWEFYKSIHPEVGDQMKVYRGVDGSEKFWQYMGMEVG